LGGGCPQKKKHFQGKKGGLKKKKEFPPRFTGENGKNWKENHPPPKTTKTGNGNFPPNQECSGKKGNGNFWVCNLRTQTNNNSGVK